jgi:hypothetical protein
MGLAESAPVFVPHTATGALRAKVPAIRLGMTKTENGSFTGGDLQPA